MKTMVKRYGGNGLLESNFIRRVQHEVSLQAARYSLLVWYLRRARGQLSFRHLALIPENK